MDSERRRSNASIVAGLGGEFLREAALLIAVFAPLDRILDGGALTTTFTIATITIAVALFAAGVLLELKRQ